MSECGFSLQVEKNGDVVYRDALFDVKCDQTIGAFYKGLESKYHGSIVDFYYAAEDDAVLVGEKDMDMNMTLQTLFDKYGQKEDGTFYVEISSKHDKATGKRLAELNKQMRDLQNQQSVIIRQIMELEDAAKSKTRKRGGSRRMSRKARHTSRKHRRS
jgi:hypothetical protein